MAKSNKDMSRKEMSREALERRSFELYDDAMADRGFTESVNSIPAVTLEKENDEDRENVIRWHAAYRNAEALRKEHYDLVTADIKTRIGEKRDKHGRLLESGIILTKDALDKMKAAFDKEVTELYEKGGEGHVKIAGRLDMIRALAETEAAAMAAHAESSKFVTGLSRDDYQALKENLRIVADHLAQSWTKRLGVMPREVANAKSALKAALKTHQDASWDDAPEILSVINKAEKTGLKLREDRQTLLREAAAIEVVQQQVKPLLLATFKKLFDFSNSDNEGHNFEHAIVAERFVSRLEGGQRDKSRFAFVAPDELEDLRQQITYRLEQVTIAVLREEITRHLAKRHGSPMADMINALAQYDERLDKLSWDEHRGKAAFLLEVLEQIQSCFPDEKIVGQYVKDMKRIIERGGKVTKAQSPSANEPGV